MSWYRAIQDVPLEENTFFLAHEFFEALPVHQFQVLFFAFRLRSPLKSVAEVIALIVEKVNLQHLALGRLGARAVEVLLCGTFPRGQPFCFVLSILFFVGFVDRNEKYRVTIGEVSVIVEN